MKTPPRVQSRRRRYQMSRAPRNRAHGLARRILPTPTLEINWYPPELRKSIGRNGPVAQKPNELWIGRNAPDLLNPGQVNPLTPGTLDGVA